MPVSIVIRSAPATKGEALPRITFDGGRVVIGRGMGCEVRLPDPSVSQRHATIRADGPAYSLVDERSSNGTFVGDVRLAPGTPRTLRTGDLVRVGRVWLEVKLDPTPATLDLPSATRDLALRLVAEAMKALGDDVSPRIEVVEGVDRARTLDLGEEGRAYLLGRGETCDLALDDVDASREHVQVVRRASGVLVRDLGSKNGAFLGETRLPPDRDVPWRAPTMLRLGQSVFALREPVAEALAELEASPDEALPEEGAPPPPPDPAALLAAPPAAPVVEVPAPSPNAAVASRRRSLWSSADLAVVVAALSIIAASAAGLYWLLRG